MVAKAELVQGPIEFVDHMGAPLIDGLIFAQNILVGSGVA